MVHRTTTEFALTFRPIIYEQVIIPLNNVAYSIYPSIIEPQDGSSSSQTQDTVLHSLASETPSPDDNRTRPSLRISVSDDSDPLIYTMQPHFVSSPTDDIRRPHHRLRSSSSQMQDTVLHSPASETPSPSDDRTRPSLHVSVSDDSDSPIYIRQPHLVPSPTDDIRRPYRHLRSSSSQTLDAFLHSPASETPSPSDDRTRPSLHISVSDVSDSLIYTTQPHFVSSPTADTRRTYHRLRSSSSQTLDTVLRSPDMLSPSDDRITPSLHISLSDDRLGSGEMSRLTRDITLVAGSSRLSSFDLSTGLHEGTTISSPTSVEDQGSPAPSSIVIYPVAPENFSRHEKRRKM